MLPFIGYHLHQAYWTLRYNIFFSYHYDFPFPINLENLLLQNFLLIIHEAGHTYSSILGNRTLTILGGSLYEITLPAFILGYFWYNRISLGVQFGFYLVGAAFISVGFYVSDAGARQLPLIGGPGDFAHDWGNLLSSWNLLYYDAEIGLGLTLIGAVCYLAAISVPLWLATYEASDIDIQLDL
ncbi:hypothetical protein [Rhodohalobacter sp. 8-1]|uniref:hypothetical protein n=1 Tax=Rhodohalobacter sp. 8-1 TaxID=3131972 RepID=UPI0030EBE282